MNSMAQVQLENIRKRLFQIVLDEAQVDEVMYDISDGLNTYLVYKISEVIGDENVLAIREEVDALAKEDKKFNQLEDKISLLWESFDAALLEFSTADKSYSVEEFAEEYYITVIDTLKLIDETKDKDDIYDEIQELLTQILTN